MFTEGKKNQILSLLFTNFKFILEWKNRQGNRIIKKIGIQRFLAAFTTKILQKIIETYLLVF